MKPLHTLLADDHDRLDALLTSTIHPDGTVDLDTYAEFRRGLLRHIGIEERVLFPAIRAHRGPSALLDQLHRDHAVLAALLVPPPTSAEIDQIRSLLSKHNPLEERTGGLYDIAESVAGADLGAMLEKAEAYPVVAVAPHVDTEITRRSIAQLIREADEGRVKLGEEDS